MNKTKKKFTKRDIFTAIFLALFVAAVILGGVFLLPKGGFGVLGLFGILLLGLVLLVTWHSTNYAYVCKECKHNFRINFYKDLFAPQTTTTKYLKCPKCGKKTWAKETNR